MPLDAARYESLTLGHELIRPYASRVLIARDGLDLPGTTTRPVPLLMYSPSVYFARLIDAAIESGPEPLHGVRLFEAEMSDVLGDMAAQGLGVAWLADSALQRLPAADLQPVANRAWDIEVAILAFKDRNDARPAVDALWQRMRAAAQPA